MSKTIITANDFPAPFVGVSLMGREVVHIEIIDSFQGSLCGTTKGHACGTYHNEPSTEFPKKVCRKCLTMAGLAAVKEEP